MEVIEEEFKALKPFYVYELIDSRNGIIFYVGKGKGERALQHQIEATNTEKSTPKLDKIRSIESSGGKVIERIIGRYDTEKEAFSVESTLIHWVYGYENLTNIAGGHGCDTIRPFGNNDKIEAIDIPERMRSFDGEYSNEHIKMRDQNSIVSFMEDVKSYVESVSNFAKGSINTDQARFTRIIYPISGANVVIGTAHSPKKLLWVEIQALDGKKESKNRVSELCKGTNLVVKNYGAQAKLPNFKSTPSKQEIAKSFIDLMDLVSKYE